MRLGGFYGARNVAELDLVCQKLDSDGLSAIPAPPHIQNMTDDDCRHFGEKAKELDIVVGETGMWDNLLTDDKNLQENRIQQVRSLLQKAEKMRCRTVVTLVGSLADSNPPLAPHPGNYERKFRKSFREVVLRILDGFDFQFTKYSIEPWHNTFFISRRISMIL